MLGVVRLRLAAVGAGTAGRIKRHFLRDHDFFRLQAAVAASFSACRAMA